MATAAAQPAVIRIAAAIIVNAAGEILLVRKAGTAAFMQPGGKIELGETPIHALTRELREELGFDLGSEEIAYLGCRYAEAANEPDAVVEAELFHIRSDGPFTPAAEIAESAWVDPAAPIDLVLAPLTRGHVLGLAQSLASQSSAN
jgi:8-oxo-dGTP pyrophosphatase MutT (NUDIX family)